MSWQAASSAYARADGLRLGIRTRWSARHGAAPSMASAWHWQAPPRRHCLEIAAASRTPRRIRSGAVASVARAGAYGGSQCRSARVASRTPRGRCHRSRVRSLRPAVLPPPHRAQRPRVAGRQGSRSGLAGRQGSQPRTLPAKTILARATYKQLGRQRISLRYRKVPSLTTPKGGGRGGGLATRKRLKVTSFWVEKRFRGTKLPENGDLQGNQQLGSPKRH